MHYWNTGDRVTDRNLSYLESLAQWDPFVDKENTHQLALALIDITPMLPKMVSRHFELPSGYIGDGAFRWSASGRAAWVKKVSEAIVDGLEKAKADDALKRENRPDLSDRPMSRGEKILDALEAFRTSRSQSDLSRLSTEIGPTNLHTYFQELQRALARKRPTANRSIEVEILSAIGKLEFYAQNWHRTPA